MSPPYRYEKVKQGIIGNPSNKMLSDDIIVSIDLFSASPVVLCRKNNCKSADDTESWRFATDNRKLKAITQYFQYPIPVIDKILANITNTNFMSALNLTSVHFYIAMKSEDIAKTAFITSTECFSFKGMSFGLSEALLMFQKDRNTILKLLFGKGFLVYRDGIIVMAATFEEHWKLSGNYLSC